MATATKLHSVRKSELSDLYYDVYLHKGPYNVPTKKENVEVFHKYIGSGFYSLTVRVFDTVVRDSMSMRRMDAIARRVNGSARVVDTGWGKDITGNDYYFRRYQAEGWTD